MKYLTLFARYICVCILTSILFIDIANAQENIQEKSSSKSSWKIGVDYLTNNVYLGRTDTIAAQVLTPTIGYTFGFGLFLSASAEYIPSRTTNKLDGGNFQIGYNFNIDDNLGGSVSWTKLFYASTSTQISSSISSTANLSLDYNLADIITPAISVDYSIGNKKSKNDFLVNPSVSHDFLIEDVGGEGNFLLIAPTVGLNAGTQNFYDSYFSKRRGKKAALYNSRINTYRASLSAFSLLDYEFSMPVTYSLKPFLFSITPTLAIPENKLPTAITAGQVNKSTLFYTDLGITVKF